MLGDFNYIDDITVPGMSYAAMKFSDHPRALVKGIDPSAALEMEGVERVITAADVPGDRYVGLIVKDWPILVAIGEETRCVGDIIAVVVARRSVHCPQGGGESRRRLRSAHAGHDARRCAEARRAEDSSQGKFAQQERDCAGQSRRSVCQLGARRGRHVSDAAHRTHVFGAGGLRCDARWAATGTAIRWRR